MKPRALMKALGFESADRLIKYDPDQPRVPAGSGRESGRWASSEGGGSGATFKPTVTISPARLDDTQNPTSPTVSVDAGALAAPASGMLGASGEMIGVEAGTIEGGELTAGLFTAGETSAFIEGLAALGLAIGGAGAVLGLIFVPSPNDVTSEGEVPGDPDLHYHLDNDVGVLRLTDQSGPTPDLVAVARQGTNGVFFEIETGLPIARALNGSVVFDAASLADVSENSDTREKTGAASQSQSDTEKDGPKLCPDPGPDVPHGASARAIAYQAQISALNNRQRPLPPGLAVSLRNPATGRRVVYDDCRESDGTMIEAKGPGFGRMLDYKFFQRRLTDRWTHQASRQISASGERPLQWFFADARAADFARRLFRNTDNLSRIIVTHVPAEMP